MNIRTSAALTCALLVASCSSYPDYSKSPPAPGPNIYRCVGSMKDVRYLRISPPVFEVWHGDSWGENACAVPGQSCTVDDAGKISVKQFFVLDNRLRTDMLMVYDLTAGTEVSTAEVNGVATAPSLAACASYTAPSQG